MHLFLCSSEYHTIWADTRALGVNGSQPFSAHPQSSNLHASVEFSVDVTWLVQNKFEHLKLELGAFLYSRMWKGWAGRYPVAFYPFSIKTKKFAF